MPIKRNKNLTLLNLPGSYIMNDEDVRLFKKEWLCENMVDAKGLIFIVPDLGEHSDYYDDFAKELNEQNFHVCTVDYIGHGKSEGSRFTINDFDNVTRDIDTNVLSMRARFNSMPIILFGYSFGAVVAAIAVMRNEIIFGGIILESPFHEFSTLPKDPINSCLCGLAGNYIMNLDLLTEDKEIIDHIRQEKGSYKGNIKASTVKAAIKITEESFNLSELKLPLLILHGAKNQISEVKIAQNILDKCGSSNKRLTVIEKGRHMMHNDTDEIRKSIISNISTWLNELKNKKSSD